MDEGYLLVVFGGTKGYKRWAGHMDQGCQEVEEGLYLINHHSKSWKGFLYGYSGFF